MPKKSKSSTVTTVEHSSASGTRKNSGTFKRMVDVSTATSIIVEAKVVGMQYDPVNSYVVEVTVKRDDSEPVVGYAYESPDKDGAVNFASAINAVFWLLG